MSEAGLARAPVAVRDLLDLAAADPRRYPCLLESAAWGTPQARYDILLAFPQDALTLHADGRVRDAGGRDHGTDFLAALDAQWQAQRCARALSTDLPFHGGWVLFLGYELAAQIEPGLVLPRAADTASPIAMALRCPAAIVHDRLARSAHAVAEPEYANLIAPLCEDLVRIGPFVPAVAACEINEAAEQEFIDAVSRVHDYLRAGDTFQVNLSREWCGRFLTPPRPADLYARLRRANPAPFAGLLQWGDRAVHSSSPERLVAVRDGIVQTRPIAGTRPRRAGDDDAARIRELVGHPKERAEHVMLIDLERNDLGRVCVPGSVRVDELMGVESYAHVHHLVSNVRGRLRDDTSPGDVIRALFPGGTITGCPKVRCMQIIAELECARRGAYTGALGYLNRDGSMDLNILIRTLDQRGGDVRLRAGAGIVADSIARNELNETRAKARGLLQALGRPRREGARSRHGTASGLSGLS